MLNFSIKLSKRAKDLERYMKEGIVRGLQKASLIVENEAKRTKSFTDRTSNLRNSIAAERVNKEGLFVEVKAKTKYAGFIEEGTKQIKARNYMKDAAKNKQTEIVRAMESEIKKELKK